MSSGSSKISTYKKTSIFERNLNRIKGTEISQAAFSFLFGEIVRYTQKRVQGIYELEKRLNIQGYRVGQKLLELISWREKKYKREIRILGILQFIFSNVWKALFNKQADALEKSKENEDEYMIVDNEPMVNKYISVPKEMAYFDCAAFVAGIVEAIMDGSQFPSKVTAHSVPTQGFPNRTVILIKINESVIEKEKYLK
ncbi:hypothetical protein PNEG_03010 [Pneumocystis murina B123]|uniref:Trafficking protein particle complex subunit n=1 Tax=Pneumocystis murina (strain B123) TaxID=1069680 RepID=M7PDJ0_PNEMU|nr:hypothetical protein PNEG_03010 [Pneumocystis murina B123]EMR08529.1 hypothetical protein PNEG_03010 [Pneumocystis murina B123]